MGRGFDISCVGVRYIIRGWFNKPWKGVQYSIGKGFDISWVVGSIYHGYGGQNTMGKGIDIPWIGVLNTMGRRFNIPWVGEGQNTMRMGFKIPWVGDLIYPG